MAKVNEIAGGLPGNAHVVKELRLMFRGKLDYCFEFHHQRAEDKKVGDVFRLCNC